MRPKHVQIGCATHRRHPIALRYDQPAHEVSLRTRLILRQPVFAARRLYLANGLEPDDAEHMVALLTM